MNPFTLAHRSLKILWHVRYLPNDHIIPVDIKTASGYKTGDEVGNCIYVNSVDPTHRSRAAIKLSGGRLGMCWPNLV